MASANAVGSSSPAIGSRDREILRELARKVAEFAALPEQEERKRLWALHNMCRGERPMVLCFPEGAWRELMPEENMRCEAEEARRWESALRRRIYAFEHLDDDTVVEPFLDVGHVIHNTGIGVETKHIHGDTGHGKGSYTWEPPIRDLADLEKLHVSEYSIDHAASAARLTQVQELFGDILTVRQVHNPISAYGLTWKLVLLRGLEQTMMDMIDCPEIPHRVLAVMRDSRLAALDFAEREGIITPRNGNQYCGSGGNCFTEELPGWNDDGAAPGGLTVASQWGVGESQELVNVSPAMFDEFALQYQKPILDRFGLNCYGCCEPLDQRYDLIKEKVRNLRRVSIAPWADQEIAAEALGRDYLFSRKPNPAMLAGERLDSGALRDDIRRTLEIARGCNLEFVMKDTHTVRNQPERYAEWARIAKEECLRAADGWG